MAEAWPTRCSEAQCSTGDLPSGSRVARRLRSDASDYGRYVRPRSFYRELPLPPSVTKATVLGNTKFMMMHHGAPLPAPLSLEYARGIVDALEARGLSTTLRLDAGSADGDLAFMAGAKFLARSGGGFSMLIGHIVQRRGGSVYPPLDHSDWLDPKQVAHAKRRKWMSFYPPNAASG